MDTQTYPHQLLEGTSPHQKLVDGKIFPKIVIPSSAASQILLEDTLQILKSNKLFLEKQLHEHGALLLRGFPLHCAADFDAFVEAIGWEEMPYLGTAVRRQVKGRVYSASDARKELTIPFHHEMIQIITGTPSKLLFFCEVEPAEAGETPILLSYKIAEKMQEEFPEFVQKLKEEGLLYIKTLPPATDPSIVVGQGWGTVLGTTDRAEAEKRAATNFGATLEWLPNGKVHMIGGPYEVIKEFDKERGRKSWFNLIVAGIPGAEWREETKIDTEGRYIVVFNDGTPLPSKPVERCKQLHEELSVDIPWRKGDVMLIDNLAVMHGRRPCNHPRRILVAMCR